MWSPICINTSNSCALSLGDGADKDGSSKVQESSTQLNDVDGIIETAERQATPEMKRIVRNMLDVKTGKKTIKDIYKEYNPIQAAIEERKDVKIRQEKEAQLAKKQDELNTTLAILKLLKSQDFIKKLTKVFGACDTDTVRIEFTKTGTKVDLLAIPCKVGFSQRTLDLIWTVYDDTRKSEYTEKDVQKSKYSVPFTDEQHNTIARAISAILKPLGLYCMRRDKACKESFVIAEKGVKKRIKVEAVKDIFETCALLLLFPLIIFGVYAFTGLYLSDTPDRILNTLALFFLLAFVFIAVLSMMPCDVGQ